MVTALNSLAMELTEGQFTAYAVALAVTGLAMLILAATGLGQGSIGERVINALIGLGFIGYGTYLLFIFEGGSYRFLWYVFILPVLLIVQALRKRFAPAS
jgi:hypothetical protein